jgi:hypothetical protein
LRQRCPFRIKVRQAISRLSLNIKRIDAQHEEPDRQALPPDEQAKASVS